MSLRWMEGFETLGTTTGAAGSADVAAGMLRKYGDLKGVSSTAYQLTVPELATGRNGGYSLRARSNSWQNFSHSLGSGNTPTNDTWIIGMAVKLPSFPDDEMILIVGRDWGNFNLRLSDTGQIAAGAGYSTILGQTTDPVLTIDNWHYIEVKVVVHDTAGSYEIRVDGVTVLSDTNVDTRGIDEDSEIVQFRPQVVDQELDDIYICDTDGTTNNDFLGQVVIEGILPSSDGDSSDWTPASGTDNYAMVDDTPTDDDTSYVENNIQGDEDLYDYGNLSTITTEPILGLQVNTDVRMNEFPGDIDLHQPVKSGTTTSDGAATNIAMDDYEVATRILETDPDTSSAWTVSGVNGTQFGIKVGT